VRGCASCQELFAEGAQLGRLLAVATQAEGDPRDLFAQVERDLKREVGLRAWLRALPSGARAAALFVSGFALVLFALAFNRRADFASFPPLVFWLVVAVLSGALALGSWRLMRGVALPVRFAAREPRTAASLLLLPVAVALLAPGSKRSAAPSHWDDPMGCFGYGVVMVTPFLLLYWLFERRDAPSVTALVSAGALAGISGNLLLYAHCGSAHLGHLLLGHASIGAALALVLGSSAKALRRGF
jgi:hypothetical protein